MFQVGAMPLTVYRVCLHKVPQKRDTRKGDASNRNVPVRQQRKQGTCMPGVTDVLS